VANAPPRDGLLELVPLSGEGLITPFAVNTFGWADEAESGAMDGMDVFFLVVVMISPYFTIVMIKQWYPDHENGAKIHGPK